MIQPTLQFVDAHQLKSWVHDASELALLDIREHGQYGEDHLFFAVPLPYSTLELNIFRLVPSKSTRIVVYADERSQAVVPAAASVLFRLGYTQVYVLEGGISSWKRSGYETFAGVNLPSKTFGEIAEHAYGTPSVSAAALYDMLQDDQTDVIVLDGRPIEEYRKMSIPGAICCPNGELALRVGALVPSAETTIVVNCAGRTRSIIGAQTLINLNVPNKVYALENGTQGWFLADLPLEHQSNRLYPEAIPEDTKPALRERAGGLIEKFDLPGVTTATVQAWVADDGRNTFLCDVRTESEYVPDALVQHTPGGQLIQATDQYIGVRKSRVVICDFDGIRAPVVASWLKQLGWDVYLWPNPETLSGLPKPQRFTPVLKNTAVLNPSELAGFIRGTRDVLVVDTRQSVAYRKNHLEGSVWAIRPSLLSRTEGRVATPVLLLGSSLESLQVLAQDLESHEYRHVYLCVVSDQVLRQAGLPLEQTEDMPRDKDCIDYLFFVHDRHDGNKAAARQYLQWETNLVSQIDEQERNTFLIQAHH
ncbi:sulfurtransferase [Paralcaligenes sp. KSB-10]|uniref:rhodanese-like domain-containing protein n=1 Tax=Paralcaligenes sp. KSB-10 TaxID=2901142 RepID=UPI001E3FE4EA|nr:rhodanese-like domain-containing protein [Paralcaligenes sp. KSB-10]UHL64022.1 sulfurtransferase [Paralcaligenes sp. KSB-10]